MPSDETHVGKENAAVREMTMMPSTIETIDTALHTWLDEEVNPFATTNQGWEKVKIRWVSGERSWQVKDDRDIRDDSSRLILPMITMHRSGFQKDPSLKGVAWAHIPNASDVKGGARSLHVSRRINPQKTAEFANATANRLYKDSTFPFENKKVVYETKTFPIPVYIVGTYTISIRTEYVQQMNEIVQPFLTRTGQINNFFVEWEGHKFEGFLEGDYTLNNNVSNLGDEERKYESVLNIKVLAVILSTIGSIVILRAKHTN